MFLLSLVSGEGQVDGESAESRAPKQGEDGGVMGNSIDGAGK